MKLFCATWQMAKKKNLKGIPHNITKSFFSSLRYYSRGYMADWLVHAATKENVQKGYIDIFQQEIVPATLNLSIFQSHIKDLRRIIETELSNNGFSVDFLVEAKIELEFPSYNGTTRAIYCYPYIVDKEGKRYSAGRLIEYAYEDTFDHYRSNNITLSKSGLFKSIRNLLRF